MPSLLLQTTPLEDALLPQMEASEVSDRIQAMRKQEDMCYQAKDYLELNEAVLSSAKKAVDEECRVKMCEWCYQVVDFCKFRRETVAIGISYLDRYVSTPAGSLVLMNRKTYQLAAMTTLYMSIKLHEPLEMETSLLADLSRGCYSEIEIAEMEIKILEALDWRLQGPSPLSFVQHFLSLIPAKHVHPAVATAIMDYSRFQAELAVSDYNFVSTKCSHLALASILNALDGIDTNLLPLKAQGKFLREIERVSGVIMEHVVEVQDQLNDILVRVYAGEAESYAESPTSVVRAASMPQQPNTSEDVEDSTTVSSSDRSSGKSQQRSPVSITDT